MDTLYTVLDLLLPNEWACVVDIKMAYPHVNIHPEHHPLLVIEDEEGLHQLTTLPFGAAPAPRIFTKLIKEALTLCRHLGVGLAAYLDDFLILGTTKAAAEQGAHLLGWVLVSLGFVLHDKKSIRTATQQFKYIGWEFDTTTMTIRLPLPRMQKLKKALARAIKRPVLRAREMSQTLGI